MRWYRDNGVLAWVLFGIVVLLLVVLVSTCNGCLEEWWNTASPPNEQAK
jgi:hypothetical protein